MAARYIDKAGYVSAVAAAVADGVEQGTLLPEDGERIQQAAALQWEAQVVAGSRPALN